MLEYTEEEKNYLTALDAYEYNLKTDEEKKRIIEITELNKNQPIRTKLEINEYMRNYQIKNKEKLNNYMKLYMRSYKKFKFD